MEPDEQNLALSQGLLGLGAGLLSGSFGHYGAFAPALGSGVQGFNQGYGNALQRQLQLKQLKMQQDLHNAQIKHYGFQDNLLAAQEAQKHQAQADAAHDQGLMSPPQPMPVGTGTILAPTTIDPQSQAIVRGADMSMPQGTQIPDTTKLFPSQPKYPIDFGGGPQPATTQQTGPTSIKAEEVPITGKLTEAKFALDQANYWKDLAGKAKTKEFRDQFMQNYRENYGKYIDLVKQETALNEAAPTTRQLGIGGNRVVTQEYDRKTKTWKTIDEPSDKFSPTPLVKLTNTQETAAAGKMGTIDAETVGAYQTAAMAGQKLLPLLKRMEANVGNTFSGATANFATDLGNVATTLGVGNPNLIKKVASSEQAVADVAELVRTKIKALGSGTAISNMDLLFTNKSMPDLLKTPNGRKMIIKAMKADIQNVIGDHRAARDYFDSHDKSLAGFIPPSADSEPVDFSGMEVNSAPPKLMKGQVIDGYMYKGGDPSDQGSWEKQ